MNHFISFKDVEDKERFLQNALDIIDHPWKYETLGKQKTIGLIFFNPSPVSYTHLTSNPEKIESQLMEIIPQKDWGNVGMGLSFLGREICRPQKPKCEECMMNKVCGFYQMRK